MTNNSGEPKQAIANVSGGDDGRGIVVNIILDDLQRNGPIAQGFGGRFTVAGRVA